MSEKTKKDIADTQTNISHLEELKVSSKSDIQNWNGMTKAFKLYFIRFVTYFTDILFSINFQLSLKLLMVASPQQKKNVSIVQNFMNLLQKLKQSFRMPSQNLSYVNND